MPSQVFTQHNVILGIIFDLFCRRNSVNALEDAVRVITGSLSSGAAVKAPVGVVGRVEAQLLLQNLGLAAHLVEDGALLVATTVSFNTG